MKNLIILPLALTFALNVCADTKKDTVYIKKLGAVPDGHFNNTAVFRHFPDNSVIVLEEGTYLLDAWVLKGKNITVIGKGAAKTKIKSSARFNDHAITLTAATDIVLMQFSVDGNGSRMRPPKAGDGAGCMTISNKAQRIYIEEVNFSNSYNKQVNVLGTDVHFTNCKFISNGRPNSNHDGLHLYGGASTTRNIVVESCKFINHQRAGLYADLDVQNVTIQNCTFDQSGNKVGGVGVNIQAFASNFNITNNTFIGNKYGVQMRSGAIGVTISKNKFQRSYSAAISIACSYSVMQIVKKGEKNYTAIATRYNKVSASTTVGKDIRITSNTFTPGVFKKEVLEPRTSAFLLLSGCENKASGNYENITVQGNLMQDPNKLFNYFICFALFDKDKIKNIRVNDNVISGGRMGIFGYISNKNSIIPHLILKNNILKSSK